MAGVIAFLYLQISKRLEKCEQDREELWDEIRTLKRQNGNAK